MTAEAVAMPPFPAVADPRPLSAVVAPPATRTVRSLVVLGDSGPAGVGDPAPGGGWRGFGPLLRDALGGADALDYANLSFLGARMACVRRQQLPLALPAAPDVAVVLVGMNDTLRSDFDPVRLGADFDAVVESLRAAGAVVLTVRFHDHTQVFWLPGPLRRALRERIGQLNAVVDDVVARHGIGCLDLHTMAGGYDRTTWSVDRLHPSESGHRLLAANFSALLEQRGFQVAYPVSLAKEGGREMTAAHRALWLVFKGLPWLARRSHDLLPYALTITARDARRRIAAR